MGMSSAGGVLARFRVLAAFLVILCLALYAMGANPLAKETVAPFDLLLSFPGWASVPMDQAVSNWQPSDIVDGLLPLWVTLKRQIREGKGALWYPNGDGGEPISLELVNPAFLIFVLVKDNALAFYLAGLAKLVIAGFGAFLLARTVLRWLPSLWAGVVFMLCGFNTAWFFWDQVTTSMWIPWLLWATVRYLMTEDRRWLPVVALAGLLMIFGGFPAVAAFGFYAFGFLVALWKGTDLLRGIIGKERAGSHVDRRNGIAGAFLPLLAVGLAFLMAAIALIPFLDNMSAVNLGYRTGGGTSFDGLSDLALLFSWDEPLKVERTAYIGGLAVVLAFAGLVAALFGTRGRKRRFLVLTALLVVLSLSIAYGVLPHALIRSLPVFNSNRWSRLIVISLLGMAVLSAAGLDRLMAALEVPRWGITARQGAWAAAAVVVLLLGFQYQSLKRFFNTYNAVVPSSWFYPATPTISYVQEHLGPLQSVIADHAYMLSGTLGAYGLPEWYAHAYRTDREKEVLAELVRDPFASPTAAAFYGRDIRFESPLMDSLAVKFVLLRRTGFERAGVLALPGSARTLSPPLNGAWRQHFFLPRETAVGAFGFRFDLQGQTQVPEGLHLVLYDSRGRSYPIELDLAREDIHPGSTSYFKFADRAVLRGGRYSVEISMVGDGTEGTLSAWADKAEREDTYLEIGGKRSPLSLNMAVGIFEPIDLHALEKDWIIRSLEPDILLFENRSVTGSAYFLPSLDGSQVRPEFSPVNLQQPSADRVEIDYRGSTAGWVVLPMHLHGGWKAFRDGRQVPCDAYLRMLPAIPVQGPCRIEFRYEPASFVAGAAVSAGGALLFVLFSWWCVRRSAGSGAALSGAKGE